MRFSSLVSLLVVVSWGCAQTSATPPNPPTPAPTPRGSAAYGGAERAAPSPSVAPSAPLALDPSEAITPRELASIPDPVPGGNSTNPSRAIEKQLPRSAGDDRRWIWRVQVFASPDLAQADRIGKEASSRFGVPFVIELEGSLYKVRLGAFASEGLAQALRERAVLEGFPGAFRTLNLEPVISSSK